MSVVLGKRDVMFTRIVHRRFGLFFLKYTTLLIQDKLGYLFGEPYGACLGTAEFKWKHFKRSLVP